LAGLVPGDGPLNVLHRVIARKMDIDVIQHEMDVSPPVIRMTRQRQRLGPDLHQDVINFDVTHKPFG
jgi:hypothetical protein